MRKLKLMALLAICLYIGISATAQPSQSRFVNNKSLSESPAILTTSNSHFGTLQWFNANRINSRNRETSPVFLNDNIVFMSTRNLPSKLRHKKSVKGDNYFTAKIKADGKMRTMDPLAGEINKYKKNGPVSFSPSGLSVFFARQTTSQSGNTIYKISYAEKSGKAWKKVQDLPVNDLEASTIHPFLTSDASRIYFASDRLGGYGGMDIYVSYYKKGYWTVPINLGPTINSDKDEVYPVLGTDDVLYFASERSEGQGGLDLYKATGRTDQDKDDWSSVNNLGAPFNSSFDDFGILIDKNQGGGFFTSNRPGGEGQEDIYRWTIKSRNNVIIQNPIIATDLKKEKLINQKPISVVTAKKYAFKSAHTEEEDHQAIEKIAKVEKTIPTTSNRFTYKAGQKITLSNLHNKNVQLDDFAKAELDFVSNILDKNPTLAISLKLPESLKNTSIIESYLSEKGIALNRVAYEKVNSASKNVIVEIASPTIMTKAETNAVVATKTEQLSFSNQVQKSNYSAKLFVMHTYASVMMEKLMLGKNTKLTKVHYDYNEYLLNDEAKAELDRVAALMNSTPSMEVSVQSHTDASGSAKYNERLSARRSYASRDYLISKGINGDRIKVAYFGEQQLIFECNSNETCSKEGQRLNRRTEIKITNINLNEIKS